MFNRIVLSSLATFFLVGCSQELSEKDAQVAFGAALTVLQSGGAMAQSSAGATPVQADDAPAFRAGAEAAVDYDFACPGGGTARFAGSVVAASDETSGQATFTFQTDFAACKSLANITIDGNMDYASSISGTAEAVQLTFSMSGSLSFSGEVEGSCDIDLTLNASATAGSAGGTFEGSVCGHDASATLNVQG